MDNEAQEAIGQPYEPDEVERINARLQGAIQLLRPLCAEDKRAALIEAIRDNPHVSELPLVIGYIAGIFYATDGESEG